LSAFPPMSLQRRQPYDERPADGMHKRATEMRYLMMLAGSASRNSSSM